MRESFLVLETASKRKERVWMGGGGARGFKCQLSVKMLAICQLSVNFGAIYQLSVN